MHIYIYLDSFSEDCPNKPNKTCTNIKISHYIEICILKGLRIRLAQKGYIAQKINYI